MGAWSILDTPPPVESQILFSCSYSRRNLGATYSPSLLNVFLFASKQLKITQLINSASFTQILNDILLLYLGAKQFLFLSCTFSIARIKKKKADRGIWGRNPFTLPDAQKQLSILTLYCIVMLMRQANEKPSFMLATRQEIRMCDTRGKKRKKKVGGGKCPFQRQSIKLQKQDGGLLTPRGKFLGTCQIPFSFMLVG